MPVPAQPWRSAANLHVGQCGHCSDRKSPPRSFPVCGGTRPRGHLEVLDMEPPAPGCQASRVAEAAPGRQGGHGRLGSALPRSAPCPVLLRGEAGSGQPRTAGGVMSPAALSPVPHRPCPRPTAPCSPKDPEKDPCPVCDPHAALMPPGVWGSRAERPSALTAPADPSPPSPLGQLCSAHIWLLFPPLASSALPAA